MIKVFVSGCYDLLHTGHLEFLEFAKAQGDYLIVSIASDKTLKELKREPVIREHDRYLMVKALRCVDECFIARGQYDNEDCFTYVMNHKPDIWVIDINDKIRPKKEILADNLKTKIIYNTRPEQGLSTTGIINEIKRNY